MKAVPREVLVYEHEDGRHPYDDWLSELRDQKGRSVIQVRVDRLEAGNFGDCEAVGEGVLELRIHFGPGYRVYCAEDGARVVLLLVGGDKKSQSRDIRAAKRMWKTYKEGRQ